MPGRRFWRMRNSWPAAVIIGLLLLVALPLLPLIYRGDFPFRRDRASSLPEIAKLTHLHVPPDARLIDSVVIHGIDMDVMAKMEMSLASADSLYGEIRRGFSVRETTENPFSQDGQFPWWKPEELRHLRALEPMLDGTGPVKGSGDVRMMVGAGGGGRVIVYFEWFTT